MHTGSHTGRYHTKRLNQLGYRWYNEIVGGMHRNAFQNTQMDGMPIGKSISGHVPRINLHWLENTYILKGTSEFKPHFWNKNKR